MSLTWGSYIWLDEPEVMIDELNDFKKNGGSSIVEVTCHGWGRDPEALKEISKRSGVHIVTTTGLYVEDCMPSWVPDRTTEQLTNWIVREIQVGCNSWLSDRVTNIRAGLIKTSVSRPSFSNEELRGLRAGARAQLLTGAPIMSHNSGSVRFVLEGGNIGMELLDILGEEGVAPEAVIVGHTDENPDIENLVTLVERGAWIQFDTIGKQNYIPDEERADLVADLKERGLLSRLLLSQDRNRKPNLRKHGGPGYSDLINRFIPMLKDKQITDEEIHTLTVKNPSKALRFREIL
jgi:phosphotriesterase-related protein